MATIKKRIGAKGTSYLIRSSCGYDAAGRHIEKSMTWRPGPGLSEKQIEKELKRRAVLFDERCAAQGAGDGSIKFEPFARNWFKEYAEPNLRPRTVARLHQLEGRTYQAIGHIRLDKLSARHIQKFIDNLGEDGISEKQDRAKTKVDLPALLKERSLAQKDLSDMSGVSRSTISALCRGNCVTLATAEKLGTALGRKDLFTIQKGDGHLSPKSIQQYLSFVSSVLDYAFRFELIPANPCKRVVLPTAEHKEKNVYTLEEAQRFLDSLEQAPIRYRAFFVLAIYSGFRLGELLGLEWPDVDFQNQVITVRRTSLYLTGKGVFTDTTKTEKSHRSLKLSAAVFDVLKQLRASQTEERMKLGDQWHECGRLFVGDFGDPLHPNTPYHWLRQFCQETNQRFLGVHAFRHLNASLLINSGVDVRTVSASLGHSTTTTTLNIYAHSFQEAQARASEAVADLLEKGAG